MKTLLKYLTLACLFSLVVVSIYSNLKAEPAIGSVIQGSEYQATTTVYMQAGTQRRILANAGTVGSIVVASSSATTFKVWDATSTTDIASTTVVHFVASPTMGTYTFDVALTRGLVIELPTGFNGSYTVTYRTNN
jgi:hypothetical protein